eukprot:7427999-Alexandrium_andersonii.AAC.1
MGPRRRVRCRVRPWSCGPWPCPRRPWAPPGPRRAPARRRPPDPPPERRGAAGACSGGHSGRAGPRGG